MSTFSDVCKVFFSPYPQVYNESRSKQDVRRFGIVFCSGWKLAFQSCKFVSKPFTLFTLFCCVKKDFLVKGLHKCILKYYPEGIVQLLFYFPHIHNVYLIQLNFIFSHCVPSVFVDMLNYLSSLLEKKYMTSEIVMLSG